MLHADRAQVEWNTEKKRWEVHILVGEEVIKRAFDKHLADSSESALKQLAVTTAKDEGYEITADHVAVTGHTG